MPRFNKDSLPEPPVSPPEPDPDEYDRNCRNNSRIDALHAIGLLEFALEELDGYQDALADIGDLRITLERDMED